MNIQKRPTYPEMVKVLFKPLPTIGEVAHHATTGISGEVGELAQATDRKNLKEECGDLEFYLEALFQAIGKVDSDLAPLYLHLPYGELIPQMHVIASTLLDLTKKSWIYGKDLPVGPLFVNAVEFRCLLDDFYGFVGLTRESIQMQNMDKLLTGTPEKPGRYPNGFYTDADALARADK